MKMKVVNNREVIKIKPGVEVTDAIKMDVNAAPPKLDIYDGVYDVTPSPVAAQELNTAHKLLERNVIVGEIPYYEVQNESGTAIFIGE